MYAASLALLALFLKDTSSLNATHSPSDLIEADANYQQALMVKHHLVDNLALLGSYIKAYPILTHSTIDKTISAQIQDYINARDVIEQYSLTDEVDDSIEVLDQANLFLATDGKCLAAPDFELKIQPAVSTKHQLPKMPTH
jgi:hypothetical protein